MTDARFALLQLTSATSAEEDAGRGARIIGGGGVRVAECVPAALLRRHDVASQKALQSGSECLRLPQPTTLARRSRRLTQAPNTVVLASLDHQPSLAGSPRAPACNFSESRQLTVEITQLKTLAKASHFIRDLSGRVLVQLVSAQPIEARYDRQHLLLCDLKNPNEHLDRNEVLPIDRRAPSTTKRPNFDRRAAGHYRFENRRRSCSTLALFFGSRAALCASARRRFPAGLRARRNARPIKDAIHTPLASWNMCRGRRTPSEHARIRSAELYVSRKMINFRTTVLLLLLAVVPVLLVACGNGKGGGY